MKALVDTNVLVDVLAERRPFCEDSSKVWTLSEAEEFRGIVSAVSLTTVFYLMRKWGGAAVGKRAVVLVRAVFRLAVCDEQVISQAIDADLEDFEDAVQYFSALRAGADCIITRDRGGFPSGPAIPVLTPTEFLAQLDLA